MRQAQFVRWVTIPLNRRVWAATWKPLAIALFLVVLGPQHQIRGQSPWLPTRGVEEVGRMWTGEPVSVFIGHLVTLFTTGKQPTSGLGTMQDTITWATDPAHSVVADGYGALAVYAHPDSSDRVLLVSGLTGMEVYSQGTPSANRDQMWDTVLQTLLTRGQPLVWGFAGDDTHYTIQPGVGYNLAWNVSLVPTMTLGALKDALRTGAFYTTNGPAINSVAVSGTTLTLTLGQASEVLWLRAGQYNAAGVSFTQGTALGRGVAIKREQNVTSSTLDLATLGIPLNQLRFVRAIVRTSTTSDALTQPFAVSATGAISNPYPTSGMWVKGESHNHTDSGIGVTGRLTTFRTNYQAVGQLAAFETAYSYWELPYEHLDSDGLPDVLNVAPRRVASGGGTELQISGVNFTDGTTVQLGPYALPTVRDSATALRAVVPATVPPGVYDVVVTTPEHYRGTMAAVVTVPESTAVTAGWTSYTTPALPWDQATSLAAVGNDLWVGTVYGAARYRDGAWTPFLPGSSAAARGIFGITADASGGVWLASVGMYYQTPAGTWPWTTEQPTGGGSQRWGRMAFDATGRLWVTSRWGEGLAIRNPSGVWERWTQAANGLPQNDNQAVARDDQGNMWVGFSGGVGIYKYTGTAWQAVTVPVFATGLPRPNYASVLAAGRNGDMWAALMPMNTSYNPINAGVVRFRADGTTEVIKTPQLPTPRVTDILAARNGDVWFATRAGVARLSATGTWQTFTTQNSGLVSNIVTALAEDAAGTVWFATDKGVSAYTPQ